ncbi:NmrA family NAD(P)-binding protein [Melittangium boletus]|uniref:NmrA family NAD(P)-binding protein n=1 Tax=Melittangium boletus TaxID=83453 RepID=UPI003DA40EF8
MTDTTVVLAGGTGGLGGRIARALVNRGATVRALVRPGSRVGELQGPGITRVEVDYADGDALARACAGAGCVVSALSGLHEVIVEAQGRLLDAAVRAGVPRFIPSDYSIDYTRLPPGSNRNLELRREFKARLDAAPLRVTSILNGAFADLLTGQAPLILFKLRRVLYWENPDQRMDFTTQDDVAAFTAAAAMDPDTPRVLRIAGMSVSARDLAAVMEAVTGQRHGLVRAGSLRRLTWLIRVARRLAPQPGALYPPWQGMQYLHGMFSGDGKLEPLDNGRYPDLRWTGAREVLAAPRS